MTRFALVMLVMLVVVGVLAALAFTEQGQDILADSDIDTPSFSGCGRGRPVMHR